MNIKTIANYQSKTSILIYLSSLFFAAFYINDFQEAQSALFALSMGWVGFSFGFYSWYANPLFLLAYCIQRKSPWLSSCLGVIALILSLSFLRHDFFTAGYEKFPITAYGFGYFLWVLAIFAFTFGRIINSISCARCPVFFKRLLMVLNLLSIFISTIFFMNYYFIDTLSHYQLLRDRDAFFRENCANAVEEIFEKRNDVSGVFFDPNFGANFNSIDNETYKSSNFGIEGLGFLNSGLLEFYETRNRSKNGKPFLRYRRGDLIGEEVDQLNSQYSVITKNTTSDLGKELGINGYKISIVDIVSKRTLAETSYFVLEMERRICAPTSTGSFSTSKFIIKTLNLTKREGRRGAGQDN
jgi:hypothetical protein